VNFPEDHTIELVRGAKKPSLHKVLGTLARRSAWLTKRVEKLAKEHGGWYEVRNSGEMRELEAIAFVVDFIESHQPNKPQRQSRSNDL